MRALLLASALAFASPAMACDLSIENAIDVSSSIDQREHRMMREGLADALMAPEIVDAVVSQEVWFSFFEWSVKQAVIVDWTRISTHEELAALAEHIRTAPRELRKERESGTALGDAMLFAALHRQSGPQCGRYVLDIVSDGESNAGTIGPREARDAFDPFAGQVINALVVAPHPNAEQYFRERVIVGYGAFVRAIADVSEFADAIRKKLIQEIAGSFTGRAG